MDLSIYVYQNFHKVLSDGTNYNYAFTRMILVRGEL